MKQKEKNTLRGHPLTDYYSRIYRRYDLINRLFTLGMDKKWRRAALKECLKSNPAKVIDLCCGTGDMTLEIRRQSGEKVMLVGFDFSHDMLEVARQKAKKHMYNNLEFIQGDVAHMPFEDNTFDSITIAFGFRNLTFENPNQHIHLSEMTRILKMGGNLVIIESAVPSNKMILSFFKLYLRLFLIPLGGLISGDWKAYRYLSRSATRYYTVVQIKELLKQYGFSVEFVKIFFFGAASMITAVKR